MAIETDKELRNRKT